MIEWQNEQEREDAVLAAHAKVSASSDLKVGNEDECYYIDKDLGNQTSFYKLKNRDNIPCLCLMKSFLPLIESES